MRLIKGLPFILFSSKIFRVSISFFEAKFLREGVV